MLGCLFLSVFIFYFYWKTIFLLMKGDEKLEYMRWQGPSVYSHTGMLAHDFFHFLSVCSWTIMPVDSFFFVLFCSCTFNSLCNFSHYKFVKESNIHSLSLTKKKKKKQQKDDHGPCYSGEWKQVNIWTARFVFIIVCVFCVEALALSNKKEVEGRREREREKVLPKKKK